MASAKSQKIAVVSILVFQIVLIILFAIFVKYDANASPVAIGNRIHEPVFDGQYPMFQDVHVMVFVGIGFLMTFLKKYGFGALGFSFMVAALVVQWGILCYGFFRLTDVRIYLSITSLLMADVIAATVVISTGVVLGRISPIQLVIMAVLETVFFVVNEYLGTEVFKAMDAGGSMYVHVFGAYFGLAVSFVTTQGIATENDGNKLLGSTYQSDITSMIGTLFLWVFWPSFNAGLLSGDEKHRAVLNTYLSLSASCLTVFAMSAVLNKNTKFEMVHVQNATLAGGVCMGTCANMMVQPYGALIIGTFAGTLSTLGFRYIQGCMAKKLRIQDTCGVHNLHGMPGIAAGIIGAIMAGMANQDTYGLKLFEVFPAMGPSHNRSAAMQACYQLVGLIVTFFIAVVGGLITGLPIRYFKKLEKKFDDELFWDMEDEKNDFPNGSAVIGKI